MVFINLVGLFFAFIFFNRNTEVFKLIKEEIGIGKEISSTHLLCSKKVIPEGCSDPKHLENAAKVQPYK